LHDAILKSLCEGEVHLENITTFEDNAAFKAAEAEETLSMKSEGAYLRSRTINNYWPKSFPTQIDNYILIGGERRHVGKRLRNAYCSAVVSQSRTLINQ
jgi:hypothetical protein